ncbi:translocation/assembly module TamB domain-containing protein [Blattabacterium cuenoti]|uniref:translocation/assembly module TamB domain-containing protein n=1 Tax=Blattabacterium cuenoti TaxID=1653831 RepID=UPI00163C11B9|nr:translocation/assembly module TamB domain-containing protein [Blattabacterium cuenoti]
MNNAFFHKFKKTRILILFLILGLFFFSIHHYKQKIEEKVSTFFLKIFMKKAIKHFNKKIRIKHASINFLEKKLIFYDVKIIDHHHFSFIRLSKCQIDIDNLFYFIFINSEHLKIKNIFIENSSLLIKEYFREKENNMVLFIKNFLIHKKLNNLNINRITCSKLIINKSYLEYKNINNNKKFQHFFSSSIKNIRINNKKIKASILSFQSHQYQKLIKKNKFPIIENLFCNLTYHYFSKLKIDNFVIKTSNSYFKGYFTLFQENKNSFPKIRCKILDGSKLGSDLGSFFYKKWSFLSKVFIKGCIHCELNHKEKIFFLHHVYIKKTQKNKFFANQIYIIYAKKKWNKIKFFKTFIQFNLYEISKIIPYNLNYKLKKFILNQHVIYKGNLTFSFFENKKNLEIKGIIQNHFFVAKIFTYVHFINEQYSGQIFIEKKYLIINENNFFYKKIPLFNNILSSNIPVLNITENFSKFFRTILFYHSEYQIHFTGNTFPHFKKIYITIRQKHNSNSNNKNIKILFINQKIRINIYDMIIGHIYGSIKWKNFFKTFNLKNRYQLNIKYVNFCFLIKKSFFHFINPIESKNTFFDIQISGEKKHNVFKMIFYTKGMQLNNISIEKLFIIIDSSLNKKIKIYIGKMFYKNFFSKKINISVFPNFGIINFKFFFKLKKQEYQKQILNFFCKKKGSILMCYPFLSKLNINGHNWFIDYHSFRILKIDFIHKKYIIDHLILSSEKQKIIIHANYDMKKKQNILQFYLKNVELKKIISYKNIDGLANGFFLYKNIHNRIEPNINITIQNFSIKKIFLGNFYIFSFQKNKNNYKIIGCLRQNDYDILKIFGNIKNQPKNKSKLNLNITIQNFRIDNFSSFWKKVKAEVRGSIKGKIQVFGSLYNLHYFGKLKIQKFGIKIHSTNTNYNIKRAAYITIYSKYCILHTFDLVDTKSNTKGYMNGFILHKNLIQWDLIKLSINTKNLLILDSDENKNNFLCGKIFYNGKIQIIKKENKICIFMKKGKILNSSHLSVNPKMIEYHKNSIYEKKENDSKKKEEYNDLLIDINTIINKNTKISIFFDKNHFVEFRGDGFLFVQKKHKKNLQTSGVYFVKDGYYYFHKNQKIPIKLEKKFKIKPGGSITWKHNFYQSNINLIAYETKYVYNVIEYTDFIKEPHHKNMIFTELRINISGEIQKPNINMEILFPGSHEYIQKKLSEKLNSFDEKTMQFISVLILGKFFIKNDMIKNVLYFYMYEIFLKKLKNILSYNHQNYHSIFLNDQNHC